MPDFAKLKELLERVEEAAASALAVEEHFAQLADAPDGTGCMMYRPVEGGSIHSAYRVTASIDAAVALVEKALPGCKWVAGRDEHGEGAICILGETTDEDFEGVAPTVPLAILSALLKALISKAEEGEGR